MSLLAWIGVALLGGCAAVARALVDASAGRRLTAAARGTAGSLAFGTFVVNLTGAFALGLVTGLAVSGDALVLIGTATIGTYTTFSTWMLQTRTLSSTGLRAAAYLNVTVSVLAGFIAICLGRAIGTLL